MNKLILKNKLLVILLLLPAFTVLYSQDAFAWGGHGGRGHYSYQGGRWHDTNWFWGLFGAGLAIGAIVSTLPPRYETVYVRGVPYYYDDGVYFRQHSGGYIVVPAPATTATVVTVPNTVAIVPTVVPGAAVVINVPNSRGGYTQVTLTRQGNGYVGPQGEYYEGNPTVDQLRALYGK
ncbi:MAG: DUF6515 family protein [Candidatus Omnitrophica bacterium]|nr:DUF6515 family protein [Candidatus Omnitrophota bacterium]MDD5652936.1 DUF6515 family protein [Candidatus Omnitrophota bacterium]